MDFETLQERLLAHVRTRVRNGELTERGLARMIGISQPHMHHILKGVRALSLGIADRILRRLDLTVLDLIEGASPGWQTPLARRPVAGIRQDQQGGWADSEKYIEPSAQPQESF